MKKRGSLSALAAAAAFSVAAPAFALPPDDKPMVDGPTIALVGGTVVNVDDGTDIPSAVVVVAGGRIAVIGPAGSTPIPPGATVIDMTGQYLAPGLFNTHVHLGLKLPGAEGDALANENEAQEALRMAANARQTLLSGVTTVRLVGEDKGIDFALKQAIDKGEVTGPRIETAGEVIVPTGGHGSLEADGPYALARAARLQIKQGASWIKIAVSGGISDDHGDISAAPMTDEEVSTLIEVAHRNGVKVTAHNGSAVAARQALKFGIDGFEHGYHLDHDVLVEMKKKGVWLVPTIVVSQPGARAFYRKIGAPDWYLSRVDSTGRDHWAMLQDAIRLGVRISLGTDQFPFEPNDGTTATVAEAELYVKAGMRPLQALQAATIHSAEMIGVDKRRGRLAVGFDADIVAMPQNPLDNISALRAIDYVMKAGAIVRDDRSSAAH